MNISLPTPAQISAFGRHVVSYAGGAATVGVAMHFLNPDQGSQLTAGITNIVNGVESIVGGIATLVALASAFYAAWTASPTKQVAAVADNPKVKKVLTDPSLAAAVPNDKVVAT